MTKQYSSDVPEISTDDVSSQTASDITSTDSTETPSLSSNIKATRSRHMRVFGTSSYLGIIFIKTKKTIQKISYMLFSKFKRSSKRLLIASDHVVVRDPFKTFVRQTVAIACALFVITSLPPTKILETGFTADYFADTDFIDGGAESELDLPSFIINDEGFVLKTSPTTENVSHIGFNDSLKHTVVSGDTLTGIAHLYGLSLKTVLWENTLNPDSTLKIGQVLTIPPVDGITHVVAEKGDTLETIAKKYEVSIDLIKEHNNLEADTIAASQRLFIPGAKVKQEEKEPVIVRTGIRAPGRAAAKTVAGRTIARVESYNGGGLGASAACSKYIFPTLGRITQGFRKGHYALDIGNQAQPDIWSSCPGKVIKVSTGCPERNVRVDRTCGGGYGNYVVVDHGGNVQTLYAHMETVYATVGQQVGAGDALGKMGNSGRTYGATGLHLHVELHVAGAKKNLSNYF